MVNLLDYKFNIHSFVVEITRRCNLNCPHCLRGKPINQDLDIKTFEKFINNIDVNTITTITFTGGEPALNYKAIDNILNIVKKKEIPIHNVYLATNGLVNQYELLNSFLKFYDYCDQFDNEISSVSLSYGTFHGTDINDIKSPFKLLKICYLKEDNPENVLNEGLAKINGIATTNRILNQYDIDIEFDHDRKVIEVEEIYLNCKGQILFNCDFSYERQEKKYIVSIFEDNWVNQLKNTLFKLNQKKED